MRFRPLLIAFGTSLAANSSSYEIHTDIGPVKFEAIHESMTTAAMTCLSEANDGAKPSSCWSYFQSMEDLPKADPGTTPYASRWPDDPTRQAAAFTYPKMGANLAFNCERKLNVAQEIDEVGLLCSSHFGRLQFMHAMQGPDDDSADQTRQRILSWAWFAYEVADGTISSETSLCAAVDGRDGLEDAFAFRNEDKCKRRSKRLFGLLKIGSWPAYTVGSFFTQTCSNPLQSEVCWEKTKAGGSEKLTRLSAKGALLHLIQDSFSQAHASRAESGTVPETGPFEPLVVCRRASDFFDYSNQETEVHSEADHVPSTRGCGTDAPIDDVVTASAVLLWHLEQGRPASEFVAYLNQRVLG